MTDILLDGITEIIGEYAKQDEELILGLLRTCGSVRNEFDFFYRVMINRGELEPIESLPGDGKQEIWDKVKGFEMYGAEKLKASLALYILKVIKK